MYLGFFWGLKNNLCVEWKKRCILNFLEWQKKQETDKNRMEGHKQGSHTPSALLSKPTKQHFLSPEEASLASRSHSLLWI